MEHLDRFKRIIREIHDVEKDSKTIDDPSIEYILKLFEQLGPRDRFLLLAEAAHCDDIQQEHADKKEPDESKDNPKKELDDIDVFNQKELIKLKVSLVKFFIVVIVATFMLILFLTVMLGSGALHTGNSMTNELSAIFGYLFD